MDLFIRLQNGQPHEHPIMADNFAAAFPEIDTNNLPPEFARFERVTAPILDDTFEINDHSYQWVDGVVKDVWVTREMNDSERQTRTEEERGILLRKIARIKEYVESELAQAAEQDKPVFQEYIDYINALTIVPFETRVPMIPYKMPDGSWASVLSNGSAPNVIG
jgi:hypothetical protein